MTFGTSMVGLFGQLALPVLRRMDPEDAHGATVRTIAALPLRKAKADPDSLAVHAFGLDFANPIGVAAGFDKNAEVPDALIGMGFGFAEVGTVTPLPQDGNPRPRIFRLDADRGVINRLGFNGQGRDAVLARLRKRTRTGIVGVNIGANKDAPDRTADYVSLVRDFAAVADYLTVNVSSPNTPGLRDLQHARALDDLLARVMEARDCVDMPRRTPVLLKIAPDLGPADLDDAVAAAKRRRIDGMIVGNTTVSRPASLRDAAAGEAGGLSGRPLFDLSTQVLARTFRRVERAFPLIGAGGIDSDEAALAKIRAGATLLQIYSGLVFRGLPLLDEIKTAVDAYVRTCTRRRPGDRLPTLAGTEAVRMAGEAAMV